MLDQFVHYSINISPRLVFTLRTFETVVARTLASDEAAPEAEPQ
jgi:hypothetical protein